MAHPLLKIYGQFDGQLKQALKKEGLKPTCQKGCAHCCYIMTAIHAVEGQLLAQAVMRLPNWREIAQRAREVSLKLLELGEDRRKYFEAGIPCPLLNLEGQHCMAYEKRPAVCRFYLVVSDPALCSSTNSEPNLQIVNTSWFEVQALQWCMELTQGVFILAPIPLMLLFSLPKAARNKEEEAHLRALCEGIPDPVQWMKEHEKVGEKWHAEEPDEVKRVYGEAFKKAFGPLAR